MDCYCGSRCTADYISADCRWGGGGAFVYLVDRECFDVAPWTVWITQRFHHVQSEKIVVILDAIIHLGGLSINKKYWATFALYKNNIDLRIKASSK